MRWVTPALVPAMALMLAAASATLHADEQDDTKKIEQLLIRAQKICPVSGKPLDSMGGPVKASIGEATMFLCCKGCFGQKILPEHWATVTENMVKSQGRCPVMDRPLPDKPKSITVQKRKIFVCCPPCTDRVKAEPEKYIPVVDRLLEKNLGNPQR